MSIERKFWIAAALASVLLLLHLLGTILTPFLVSALLAWLGDPLADRLESWKFPRSVAVVTVFLGTLLLLVLLVLLVLPMAGREFAALSTRAPQFVSWFQESGAPWIASHLGIDPEHLRLKYLADVLTQNVEGAGQFAGRTLLSVSTSGGAVLSFFLNLLLIPVVTFYLLRDWDILMARLRELLPRQSEALIVQLARECDAVLAAFFRGQLLVMLSLALVYSAGLSLVGLENAIAVGVITGLLSFVPYLGVSTGIVLALLSAVLQGGDASLLLWVLGVFVVGHLLESFVLTPRIVGDRIGLHPVLVIFAILAGGRLFGFTGVLLALPVAAAGTVFVRHMHASYIQSDLYRSDDGKAP